MINNRLFIYYTLSTKEEKNAFVNMFPIDIDTKHSTAGDNNFQLTFSARLKTL